jgi:hypothetical protein
MFSFVHYSLDSVIYFIISLLGHIFTNILFKYDICWRRHLYPHSTWCFPSSTTEALKSYFWFHILVPSFRLVTCGLAVSHFSVACPNDAGMLDVAGFDAEVPRVIEAFSRGAF